MKTIGTDLELFAKDKDGHHKSVIGLVGGSKEYPKQLVDRLEGFCVQEDNVALEFNIPPATNKEEFVNYVTSMSSDVGDILGKLGFQMSHESSVLFTPDELNDERALVFGCEPDYDAWTRAENIMPTEVDPALRTAGGHIHIGGEGDITDIAKQMDLLLGVPSVLMDDTLGSRRRRELYGKAGSIRPKPYGFEYRTLSNFWMFNEKLIAWVYDQSLLATQLTIDISKSLEARILQAINEGDKDVARDIIKDFPTARPV
jgi:hypothetical protein